MKRAFLFAPFVLGVLVALPLSALADAPAIALFKADPPSASYSIGTDISWKIVNGLAPDFYISCPSGVSIKKDSGLSIPCNTLTTLSPLPEDIAALSFVNLTGVSQTLGFRLIPKGNDGSDYSDLAQTLNVSVGPVPQPITYFSSSSSTPASGSLTTFTWTGIETPGVNFRFDCNATISVLTDASNSFSALPCDQPALSTDLPQSGSQAFTIVNRSPLSAALGVKVLPAVTPGVYDATHGQFLTLYIGGNKVPLPPSVSVFSSSLSAAASGDSVTFSWAVDNADGANMQFSCADGIQLTNINGSIPCNSLAFGAALSAVGSTTVTVSSAGVPPRTISALLLPYLKGTYDATKGKSLTFLAGVSKSVQSPNTVASPTGGSTETPTAPPTAPSSGSIKAYIATPLTTLLKKGSRGAQVAALQQFLAEDPSLYPEGTVSGYFGALTEAAVQRFQARYGIVSSGSAATTGYGAIGPKTRAKMNSLQYF
jgi:hypothetical protein